MADDPDEVMTTYGPQKRLESQRGDPDAAFASVPISEDVESTLFMAVALGADAPETNHRSDL